MEEGFQSPEEEEAFKAIKNQVVWEHPWHTHVKKMDYQGPLYAPHPDLKNDKRETDSPHFGSERGESTGSDQLCGEGEQPS